MPLVGRPIELIMPPSTSAARGGGLPARYSRDTVFATMAPSWLMSITWARSVEKQPEPGITGFCSVTDPICTRISTIRPPPRVSRSIFRSFPCKRESSNWVPACAGASGKDLPSDRLLHVEHRPFDADAAQLFLAVHFAGADTDVAGAEPTRHHLLHRHLARNIMRLAEPLHQLKQPV